jgi:hypothetical protein
LSNEFFQKQFVRWILLCQIYLSACGSENGVLNIVEKQFATHFGTVRFGLEIHFRYANVVGVHGRKRHPKAKQKRCGNSQWNPRRMRVCNASP